MLQGWVEATGREWGGVHCTCLDPLGRRKSPPLSCASEARAYFATSAKQVLTKTYDLKSSVYKQLLEVLKKLGPDHGDVVTLGTKKSVNEFEEEAERLKALKGTAKQWCKKTFVDHFAEGMGVVSSMVEKVKKLEDDLGSLKAVRLLEVRALSGDRRRAALQIRKVLKTLFDQVPWKPSRTWLGEEVLGVTTTSSVLAAGSNIEKHPRAQFLGNDPPWLTVSSWKAGSTDSVTRTQSSRINSIQNLTLGTRSSSRQTLWERMLLPMAGTVSLLQSFGAPSPKASVGVLPRLDTQGFLTSLTMRKVSAPSSLGAWRASARLEQASKRSPTTSTPSAHLSSAAS